MIEKIAVVITIWFVIHMVKDFIKTFFEKRKELR